MILRRLGWINKGQRGFTLIELLVALAITGLLASGLTVTIFQLFSGNAQSSNQMNVVRQVQNAGYWLSRDGQMAQSMAITGVAGFPATFSWTDYEAPNDVHQVVYSLSGGEITRAYSINGIPSATTFVAQYIDPDNTNYGLKGGGDFSLPDANVGTEDEFTITDPVGGDSGTISVTIPGSVVKVTPYGGATVDGGTVEVTINIASGAVTWTTPVAGSYIVVAATAMNTFGTWGSTSGNVTAVITTDSDGNATFSGNSNSVLAFTVTASISGLRSASETRIYEVTPRPS